MLGLGLNLWQAALGGGGGTPIFSALVGLFQDADGATPASSDGNPIGRWNAGSLAAVQVVSGARPTLSVAGPRVVFDGVDDYLAVATPPPGSLGSVVIAFRTGGTAFSAAQVLLSCADVGAANEWLEIGMTAEGKPYIERNAAGTKHTVVGSSFLENSTDYILSVVFDDVDYYMQLGAVEQNPLIIENVGTPGWFGDVAAADNTVLGGTVTSGGLVRPFQGALYDVTIYSADITA